MCTKNVCLGDFHSLFLLIYTFCILYYIEPNVVTWIGLPCEVKAVVKKSKGTGPLFQPL